MEYKSKKSCPKQRLGYILDQNYMEERTSNDLKTGVLDLAQLERSKYKTWKKLGSDRSCGRGKFLIKVLYRLNGQSCVKDARIGEKRVIAPPWFCQKLQPFLPALHSFLFLFTKFARSLVSFFLERCRKAPSSLRVKSWPNRWHLLHWALIMMTNYLADGDGDDDNED